MSSPVGVAAPYSLVVEVIDDEGFDFSAATGATFELTDGRTWDVTIESAGIGSIIMRRIHASGGSDFPSAGRYEIQPVIAHPSGTLRGTPIIHYAE